MCFQQISFSSVMSVQMHVTCPKLNIKLKLMVLILLSGNCNSDIDHVWTFSVPCVYISFREIQNAAVATLKYSFP